MKKAQKMLPFFKPMLLTALLLVLALSGCKHNSGNYDYVSASEDETVTPVLTMSGLTAVSTSDYDYFLDETGKLPGEATGSFTVYVQNAKPGKILVKSSDSQITVTQTAITETDSSDSVGEGAWKSVVTYTVAESLTLEDDADYLSATLTATAQFSTLDAVQKVVMVNASYIPEDEAYALTDFVVSDQNEHVFTLSWSNPVVDGETVTLTRLTYKVYQIVTTTDADTGEETTEYVLVESGTLSDANAGTFTTKTVISAQSNYYVELIAVASGGWYTTTTVDVDISTTDDITPPNAPALTVDSNAATEESVVLTYTKYTTDDTIDDTAYLVFAVTQGTDAVSGTSISVTGVDVDGDEVTADYDDDSGLYVLDLDTTDTAATITISGLPRAQTAVEYTITVHAIDELGNDSADTTGTTQTVNDEDNRYTTVTASTVADTTAPADVTDLVVDLSAATSVLTWTAPEDSDFAAVNVYVDSATTATTSTLATATQSAESASFASATTLTVKTVDEAGNESSGIVVAVDAAPTLSAVTTGYTGQLVVTLADLDTSSASWTAAYNGDDDVTVVLDSANSVAYVNGLEVGTAVTPSIIFTGTYSAYSITSAAVTAGTSVAPTMTVWKIKNVYSKSDVVPYNTDSVSYNNVIATSTWTPVTTSDATYDRWIVYPALDGTIGGFSLSAAQIGTSSLVDSGLYMYADIDLTQTWSSDYNSMSSSNWSYSCSSSPQLWVAAADDITSESYASFTLFAGGATDDVPSGYDSVNDGWNIIQCTAGSYYLYCSCLNLSAQSSYTSTNGDYNYAIAEAVWTGSEATDNPTAITVTADESDDHSLTLTWTDPSDADFSYLTIATSGTEMDGTTSVDTQTISAGTQTATFESLSANTSYSFTVTLYDMFGNSTVVTTSATTASDSTAPEAVTALTASAGRTSVTLTWTASTSDDVKQYAVYVDSSSTASVTVDGSETSATVTSLTSGTSYTFAVKAVDYNGNESDSATVTGTPATPTPSDVAAAVQYTGSILVTWTDSAAVEYDESGTVLTYTYTVSCSDSNVTSQEIAAGVGEAHFTGLTVGTEYTFTVTITDSDSVTCGSATATATAKTVIWQILSGYGSDRYLSWATSSGSSTCYNTAAIATSNATAYLWIVRPALSGTDGYFSLEATKSSSSGLGTGYFLYYDTNSRPYVAYNGTWGGGKGVPYAMVATLTGIENDGTSYITDSAQASFKLATSSYGNAWSKIVCEKDDYYIQHASLTYSMISSSTTEDSDGCGAFQVSNTYTANVDYYTDAPAAVTNLSASETLASSVTLTWTQSSSGDASYVIVSCSDTNIESVKSTGTTATIEDLTASTYYTFTVTSFDFYGNACTTPATVSVMTAVLVEYPQDVAASLTASNTITVTWTDIAATGYTYTVSCTSDDSVSAAEDIEKGVKSASFSGLTAGTEYTFKVSAYKNSTEYTDESATATVISYRMVHIMGGGSKYLQIRSGNPIAFFATDTTNEYTWIVTPALNGDENMFSLKSADEDGYWLMCDLGTDHSGDTAPSGGWTSGSNTTCAVILTTEPTTDDGKKQASFKETDAASGDSDYRSYLMNGDTSRYLRDWWNIANCNSAQTGNDVVYSSQKMIDVTD